MATTGAHPVPVLLVHVASLAVQTTLCAVDRSSAALHGHNGVFMTHVMMRTVDAVLGAIPLEDLAPPPRNFALAAGHWFPTAADGSLGAMN